MSVLEQKTERLRKALSHQEGDRVPIGESCWTGFIEMCQKKWGSDFDPFRYFDLDYASVIPNSDPKIQPFEVVYQSGEDIIVKTGFGATIRRTGTAPMPHYDSFSISRPEEMADFEFDDPKDPRRFYSGGDDQINCVADVLERDLPSWDERMNDYAFDFPVFGGVLEPYEYVWRVVGTENALMWMAMEPEMFAAFVDRIGAFNLAFLEAQIEAAKGRLKGMYIYGDVAYRRGMMMSPATWRELFKPHVKSLIDKCHEHDLMVIYHGCGNAFAIFEDFVEIGLDCYNPLEAKADLDVVKLKDQYGGRMAFCGNVDVRILERGNPEEIKQEVRYKLQAGKGGGFIFQSDHSISTSVTPESYALVVKTFRELADYPLDL